MSQESAQPGAGLPPGQVATLTVVRGPDTGLSVTLSAPRTVIGRRQGEILLTDREVSGLHAAVEYEDGRFVLKDLGSTNGVFLEGEKVSSKELTPGCHLKCGATYLRFDLVDAADEASDDPLLEGELIEEAEPLVAAEAGEPEEADSDLGLGAAPPAFDDEPLVPPAAPVAAPEPPDIPEEVPTGVAPPSSVPTVGPVPPAPGVVSPGGVVAPAGPASSPGPSAPKPPEPEPEPEPQAPPARVGVTSHGEAATSSGGTPWDSLSMPKAASAPIPPSPGASPHVQTPIPGSIQVPPSNATSAPTAPPSEPPFSPDGPTPPPMPAAAAPAAPAQLPAGVATSPHGLYLVVEAGADQGKVFPILKDLTVLGRSDLDVQIRDPDVSRKHVAMELQGENGPHVLRDLGSTNGTLLNGVKVTENLISPNDIIRMGVTRLKLVAGESAVVAELNRIAAG